MFQQNLKVTVAIFVFVLAALSLGLSLGGVSKARAQGDGASFVFRNGIVYSADTAHSMFSAVAVKGDKIIAVGKNSDVEPFITAATRVIDLKGGLLVPGLIDAHVHVVSGASIASKCSFDDAELTLEQMRPIITVCLKDNPGSSDKWFEVVQVNPSGLEASAKDIDRLISGRPALFSGSDGHTAWLNSKGLVKAKITKATKDPNGGKIVRDAQNNPTGKLIDAATSLPLAAIPQATKPELVAALAKSLKAFNAFGITSVRDPAIDNGIQNVYEMAWNTGLLSVRVAESLYLDDMSLTPEKLAAKTTAYVQKHPGVNDRLNIDQVKVFADGVIEAPTWTAALLEPYLDKSGKVTKNWGELYYDAALFKRQVLALHQAGFSIHVHAIGDRAVRSALDAFEYARKNGGPLGQPDQIVHLQLIDPKDFARFVPNRVIAGFQADWAFREAYTVQALEPFLGALRYKNVYPIKSVADTGATLAGGSDWPVSTFNPFQAIQRAVTRRDTKNAKPLGADQAINVRQALDMYTRGAAASLPFKGLGQIVVGNKADLALLSQNILEVDPNTIEKTVSQLTMLGGKVIFERQ